MSLVSGVLLGAFIIGTSLVIIPIFLPNVFFRVVNKIIDWSEEDSELSDW